MDHFVDKHPPIVETAQLYYNSYRKINAARNNIIPSPDHYNLKAFQILSSTTDKEIEDKITQATQEKSWLIFIFNQIGGSSNHQISTITPARLNQILQMIKKSKLPVVLPAQALSIPI